MKKLSKVLYNIYFGIGILSIGLLALDVIFTVIMRYVFSMNWKELSEFNVTLFAFSTFWGMGINVLNDEHVMIDVIYDRIAPPIKRWVAVFNNLIVLAVMGIFVYYGWIYTQRAGVQISMGMEIPMSFMYGIMPLSGMICMVCVIIKIIGYIRAPLSEFAPKNIPLEKGDAVS